MPEGKQQRPAGPAGHAKQVDANKSAERHGTQDRPQALYRSASLPPGRSAACWGCRAWRALLRSGAAARYCRAQCHLHFAATGAAVISKGSLCFIFRTGGTQHSGRVPPPPLRRFGLAALGRIGAAGMELAALGRVGRGLNGALQHNALAANGRVRIGMALNRGEQRNSRQTKGTNQSGPI